MNFKKFARRIISFSQKNNLEKIIFPLDEKNICTATAESMWAEPLGKGIYLIQNSPFNVYGISYNDQIKVKEKNGRLVFSELVKRGGHSTYRIRIPSSVDSDQFLKNWDKLEELGCTYEWGEDGEHKLYTIDLSPKVSVEKVYKILQDVENKDFWEFEEAHYFNETKSMGLA